ncbi:MAG TPA: LssY C-terminal domain-containing protein [Terriglobia bacterium]|nr:LssY C-terminal domain-containing protein [Terriglobia bacterium]
MPEKRRSFSSVNESPMNEGKAKRKSDFFHRFRLWTSMLHNMNMSMGQLDLEKRTRTLLASVICFVAIGPVCVKTSQSQAGTLSATTSAAAAEQPTGEAIPAGTRLFIRLDTPVSTETSHLHAPIAAHVVREVATTDGVLIPLSATVSGSISKLIPSSSPTDRARLKLQFDHLGIPGQPAMAISGHIAEVENAKESTLADGTIQGVLASELPVSFIDGALGKFGSLGANAEKKVGNPKISIDFPAGTDLQLILDQPLALNQTFPPAAASVLPPDVQNAITRLLADAPQRCSGKTGKPGDPLNLIFVGSQAEILHAFDQAGWAVPAQSSRSSLTKTAQAAMGDVGYGQTPISDLYLYGKKEELGFEKMFNTFAKRHHLRLWRAPVKTTDGRDIWLSSSTHDVGIDIHPGVVSHATEASIDLERDKVGADLVDAGDVAAEQLVTRPNPLSEGVTATGGKWNTDGFLRAIVLKPGS